MSLIVKQFYCFGDFMVDIGQKVLLHQGKITPLTPKVFDTLLVLIENRGRIVEKKELMNRLWPDSFVEESNLTFNIQQLRKGLGDNARQPRFIETVARRGYRFIVPVEEVSTDDSSSHITQLGSVDSSVKEGGPGFRSKNSLSSQTATPAGIEGQNQSFEIAIAGGSSLRRHRKRLSALAITLTVVLVGAAVVLWEISNASRKSLGDLVATLPLRVERLTASGQSNNAAISPDGKYLAYTRTVEGKQSVWMRQLAANTNVEIVPAGDKIFGVAFTNSGEYLYFVRGKPTALYRVSLLGDVPIKILEGLEGRFSLSPDDHQVAFIRISVNGSGQEEYSLMIANSDGRAEHRLLVRNYPEKLDAPAWSPDGDSIICARGSSAAGNQSMSLIEVSVGDGTTRELSSERFANIARIVPLPRKQGLIMSANKTLEGYRQLWSVSFPKMEFKEITAGFSSYSDLSITSNADKIVASQSTRAFDVWVGESRDAQNLRKITAATDKFCWTPDRHLVYSLMDRGSVDLWIMRPDGQEQRQLTVKTATNASPAVTSDGHYIVFISNRDGAFQVWRMNIEGSNPVQLTNGGGKNFPTISPDGKWILYNTTDDWRLWKVSIDGGEPARLTEYYALLPSVSPDGKLIACLGRTDSKVAILVLPFAGGAPLKTFDLVGQNLSGNRIQWAADGKALIYATEQNGMTSLVKHPLSGGRAAEITKFEDELFDFGYSLDGQLLAVTRGGWQHDIVLLSDVNLR